MFKNKAFAIETFILIVLGLFFLFFYVGLQNDHINVLTPYLQEAYGWSDLKITNPITAASYAAILFVPYYRCRDGKVWSPSDSYPVDYRAGDSVLRDFKCRR